jgi:hypothetical protein
MFFCRRRLGGRGGVGWATISIRYPARVHTESPSLAAAFAACSATAAIFFPYLDANLVGEGGGVGAA